MPRAETDNLVIDLEARVAQFEKNFAKANRTASQNWSQIERRGQRASRKMQADMAKATSGITASFAKMGSAITGILGGLGIGVGTAGLQRLVTDSLVHWRIQRIHKADEIVAYCRDGSEGLSVGRG